MAHWSFYPSSSTKPFAYHCQRRVVFSTYLSGPDSTLGWSAPLFTLLFPSTGDLLTAFNEFPVEWVTKQERESGREGVEREKDNKREWAKRSCKPSHSNQVNTLPCASTNPIRPLELAMQMLRRWRIKSAHAWNRPHRSIVKSIWSLPTRMYVKWTEAVFKGIALDIAFYNIL